MIITVSNTNALWSALKTAHAGDTILLAPGTYSALSLTGFNFNGQVNIQSADNANQAVINGLTLSNSSGLAFNHVEFVSNGATAVTVGNSQNISFDTAKIHGASLGDGNGMMIRNSTGVTVNNTDFGKLGTGINEMDSKTVTISNNTFHDIQSGAIRGSTTTNETISGNHFVDAKSTVADHSDVIQLWQDNTANHVTIANNSYGVTTTVTTPPPVVTTPPPVVVTTPPPVVTTPPPASTSSTGAASTGAHTMTVSSSASLMTALKTAHAGDTILLSAGNYSALTLSGFNFSSAVTIQSADSAHQAVISGLTLSGSSGLAFNHVEVVSNGGTAVTVLNSQNVSFDTIKDHGANLGDGNGMMIRGSTGVAVTNSDFGKLGTGINELDSKSITVTGNTFHDIQSGAIRGSTTTNETISGNHFLDGKATVADHSDVIQLWQDNTANHVTITGNTFGAGTTTTTPPPITVGAPPPTNVSSPPPSTGSSSSSTTTTSSTGAHTTTVSTGDDLYAALKTAHAGDVIKLAAGNYSAISLNGFNFTGGGVTVESADNSHQAVLNGLTVNNSSGLTFDHLNLNVNGSTSTGANVGNSSNITISAVTVHGTTGTDEGGGVFVRSSSNVTVTGSDFSAIGSGIGHLDDTGLTFTNNNFHNLATDGIYGGGSNGVLVSGNHFQDFFPEAGAHPDAIQFWGGSTGVSGSNVTITDNVIVRGAGDPIQGIFLESTNNVIITGNAMSGTMYNGISVSTTNNVLIADNFLQGYTDMDTRIMTRGGSANVVVQNNTSQTILTYNDGGVANPNYVQGANTTVNAASVGDVSAMNTWLSHHVDATDLAQVNTWITQHAYTASNWIAL